MSVYATPITLTDADILFQDLAAANNFFSKLELPPATKLAAGIVKMAALPLAPDPASVTAGAAYGHKVLDENDNETLYNLCTQASYEALVTEFNKLQTQYAELLNKLISAGIVSPT